MGIFLSKFNFSGIFSILCFVILLTITSACKHENSDEPILNPAILVSPANSTRFSENGGTGELTVTLNTLPDDDVAIAVFSDDPSEVTVGTTSLIFTPDDWNVPQTVLLTAVDDDFADDEEAVLIQFEIDLTATKDKTGYKLLDPANALVTVEDDETPSLVAVLLGPAQITEKPQDTTTMDISLAIKPDDLVIIDVLSKDTTEATIDKSQLTFTPENYDVPQLITITSVEDSEIDPTTPVDINFSVNKPLTAATRYHLADPMDVSIDVVEDLPPLTIYINDLTNSYTPDENELYLYDEDGNFKEIIDLPLSYNFSYAAAYNGDIYSGQWTLVAPNNVNELTITKNRARIIQLPDVSRDIDGVSIPDIVVTSQGIFFLGFYTSDNTNTIVFQYDHNGGFIGDYDLTTDYSNRLVGNELGFMNLSGGIPDQQLEFFDPVMGTYDKVIAADFLTADATAASRDQFYVCGKPDKESHELRAYSIKGDLKRTFGLALQKRCRAVAVTEKAFYIIDEDLKDLQTTNHLRIYDRVVVRDTSDNIISESMTFRKSVPLPSYYVNSGENKLRVENIFFDPTLDQP